MNRLEDAVDLAVDALATLRLTKLISNDKLTEDLREYVWERFGDPSDPNSSKVSYLLTCPWCLSIYLGAGVVAARMISPKAWRPAARALALSALTGLIAEREG